MKFTIAQGDIISFSKTQIYSGLLSHKTNQLSKIVNNKVLFTNELINYVLQL